MKRLILPLLICISLSAEATHTLGGAIYWKCLDNGKYQFFMEFYRDCSGIPWTYYGRNHSIEIFGAPLPKDSSSNTIDRIGMNVDSVRFEANRNGDNTPICDPLSGNAVTCPNANSPNANGFVQIFYYASDPITLQGVPPLNGWHFRWESFCCRPGGIRNADFNGVGGPLILRSTMFPKDNLNANPCYDSSPVFGSSPNSVFCRGSRVTYNTAVLDADFDSLVYNWDAAVTTPIDVIPLIPFLSGYSMTNPTPDTSFDSGNISSSLNSSTGIIDFKVASGAGTEKFLAAVRVDAYREGTKISSTHREFPLSIFDCPKLPNGKTNLAPKILLDGVERNELTIDVTAGDQIVVPIEFIDDDSTGLQLEYQFLSAESFGSSFSSSLTDSVACPIAPCPQLLNDQPVFDTLRNKHILGGRKNAKTELTWQTDSAHLCGKTKKKYQFYFQVQDDLCPIPETKSAVVNIVVHDTIITVGLEENVFQAGLRSYPNPTTGEFIIELDELQSHLRLQIRDVQGKLIEEGLYKQAQRLELNLKGQSGIYFIHLTSEKGEQATFKLIKQ